MAWDFSTDPEFQEKLDWVEQFCKEKVEPLDYVFPYAVRSPDPVVKALRPRAPAGGQGPGPLGALPRRGARRPRLRPAQARPRSTRSSAATARPRRCSAPPRPTPGTWRCSPPTAPTSRRSAGSSRCINQEMFSAYSMTEPQGGSDPNLFKTHAATDGEEWVINGEKWFTSAGRVADILFVMCTNGMFVVPRDTPGRGDPAGAPQPQPHHLPRRAGAPRPPARPRGRRQGARPAAPRRRSHPPRHAHHRPVQAGLRHDVRAGAVSRESHGKIIAEHQMVQEKIADSYAQIRMLRLFVLETAWKIDNTSTQEARTDIAAVKYTMAKVLREVSFNALHILGSPRHHRPHADPGHVRGGADHGHRRRRRRGAQGHRRPAACSRSTAPTRATGPPSTSRPSARRRGRRCSRVLDADPDLAASAEQLQEVLRRPPLSGQPTRSTRGSWVSDCTAIASRVSRSGSADVMSSGHASTVSVAHVRPALDGADHLLLEATDTG